MKILYLATIRLPTEKAHGLQIMKTCEALARLGHEIILFVPRRKNRITQDPFLFYGVERLFAIVSIPCLDLIPLRFFGKIGFWMTSRFFFYKSRRYVRKQLRGEYLWYTRDFFLAAWLSVSSNAVFYEAHSMPERITFFHRRVWRRLRGLIVISCGLQDDLLSAGLPKETIIVAPDGVDPVHYSPQTKAVSRDHLGLPAEKKIVVYTGHLYPWKGAHLLAEAAGLFKDTDNVEVYIVGGTEEDRRLFQERYPHAHHLHSVAFRPHEEMPIWHHAADVLVLPTSNTLPIGRRYTSPMKLFEYMMAERPILAADIPSLREILDESTSFFFQADTVQSLRDEILSIVTHEEEGRIRSKRARQVAETSFSWAHRAETISNFLLLCTKNLPYSF